MSKPGPHAQTLGPLFSTDKDSAVITASLQSLLERARKDPHQLKKLQKALRRPERFMRAVVQAFVSATAKTVPVIFRSLKANGPAMLRERRAMIAAFERRLYKTWRRPLDLLEMLIVASAEAGESASAQWPWKESKDRSLVFDVVRRLQARACQVACEVLTLLKTGYAPAAHARWRTLHETAVTAAFIAKHGKPAAERFLAHEHVEAKKAARQYQRYTRRLGQVRYSLKEMATFRRRHRAKLKKYGPQFKDDYGWAAVTLGVKRATFADIEKDVGLDHMRPYYKMASYPVHATVKAIRFSLALAPGQDLLLTGPSNLGLTDPGHGAAIALAQTTITMLTMLPTSDSISVSQVLLSFADEIGQAFLVAQKALLKKGKPHGHRARPRRSGLKPHVKAGRATRP